MEATTAPTDWISRRAASALLGVGERAINSLIARQQLTTREVPGSRLRVLRADVERLAATTTTPARPA